MGLSEELKARKAAASRANNKGLKERHTGTAHHLFLLERAHVSTLLCVVGARRRHNFG